MFLFNAEIIDKQKLSQGIFRLRLKSGKDFCRAAKPGRFVMLGIDNSLFDPLLRRPFGLCRWHEEWFEVVIKNVGRGSAQLCQLEKGGSVAVHGPLGNGYPQQKTEEGEVSPLFLVAGGMGIASIASYIFSALDSNQSLTETFLFYGAASYAELILLNELTAAVALGLRIKTITDDGSCGRHGLVTQILAAELLNNSQARIFACGPEAMLKSVQKILQTGGNEGYLSLENRMACGFGVCLGCVQTVFAETGAGGVETAKVCTQGPVFPARKVIF
ncbi:MAG: hypothetical protein JXR80_01910 [Deltaproteobacteria bacterium]|nr:hypothetical protein [Deltaproteobacteria bacterium]